MIAIDTSALMSILLGEPEADACMGLIEAEPNILISSGTLAEAMIVASRRNVGEAMRALVEDLNFSVVPVTADSAYRISDVYRRWGKGVHPAGLNFGDCFAYDVASAHQCPLLYIGEDFARTDVVSALAPHGFRK